MTAAAIVGAAAGAISVGVVVMIAPAMTMLRVGHWGRGWGCVGGGRDGCNANGDEGENRYGDGE